MSSTPQHVAPDTAHPGRRPDAPRRRPPAPLPAPAHDTAVDGFAVTYEGTVQAGATLPITMRVYIGGAVITDLQRYLGAYGHLVELRADDLAYLLIAQLGGRIWPLLCGLG